MEYLYIVGGTAALFAMLIGNAEVIINFFPGGSNFPETVTGWFTLLQSNTFLGLRNLGLLNLIFIPMGVPIFLALFAAHRKVNTAFSALAMIISFIGITVFLATNRAFPMLMLSNHYAAATTDTQKSVLIAAGQAMLSVGQSHSPDSFIGFLSGNIAGIIISLVMLKEKIFSKVSVYCGILGFSFLLIYEICNTFIPPLFEVIMVLGMSGGLLCVVWHILVAVRLFRLGQNEK